MNKQGHVRCTSPFDKVMMTISKSSKRKTKQEGDITSVGVQKHDLPGLQGEDARSKLPSPRHAQMRVVRPCPRTNQAVTL